jgi:hypothetical protein
VLADTYKSARNRIPGNPFTPLLQVAADPDQSGAGGMTGDSGNGSGGNDASS